MGKIRVATLGDESQEKKHQEEARKRREAKKLVKEKEHVKGVGLKGGQQIKMVEGVELKPEVEELLKGEVKPQEVKKTKKIKHKTRSKRYQAIANLVDKKKIYPYKEAIDLMKKTSTTKFDATVETHININPEILTKEKPTLSGSVNLPHGTGKKRIIKIADDETVTQIAAGKIDFDVLVAHPSMMSKLAKVARILGPKGLMPNPKNGTVTPNPEKRAKELEGGEITWKNEPDHPVIHQAIGKASFTEAQISENLKTLVKSIGPGKIVKLTLSSSMGPGIKVDTASI